MIESATWTEDKANIRVVMDDGTVLWVPDDMANAHRQALEEWSHVKDHFIQPYVPPAEPKK